MLCIWRDLEAHQPNSGPVWLPHNNQLSHVGAIVGSTATETAAVSCQKKKKQHTASLTAAFTMREPSPPFWTFVTEKIVHVSVDIFVLLILQCSQGWKNWKIKQILHSAAFGHQLLAILCRFHKKLYLSRHSDAIKQQIVMHGDCHINHSSIFWHMTGIMGRLCSFLFSFFCFSAMPWKQTPLIKSQAQKRRGQIRSHTYKKNPIKTHSLVSGKLHLEAARRWRCVIVGQTAYLARSNQSCVNAING